MPYVLQTNRLTKAIGGKNIVEDVNLHVKKGEIYGFLGPNGAGKTTVMKIITNFWKPTEGNVEIFGSAITSEAYEVLKRDVYKRQRLLTCFRAYKSRTSHIRVL